MANFVKAYLSMLGTTADRQRVGGGWRKLRRHFPAKSVNHKAEDKSSVMFPNINVFLKNCRQPFWLGRFPSIFEFLPLFSSSSDIHVAASHSDVRRATPPPRRGREGRKKREGRGGAGRTRHRHRTSELLPPTWGKHIRRPRPPRRKDICAAAAAIYLLKQDEANPDLLVRINLGAILARGVPEPYFLLAWISCFEITLVNTCIEGIF